MKKYWKGIRLNRREFLRKSALTGLGAALFPLTAAARPREPSNVEVRRYVPLGRTGIKMSDISFGSSRLDAGEESIVLHALDRGINYFDTAESYSGSDSETTIGNALRGKRDKVTIASKVVTGSSERKESMMGALEGSLRRLRTDYVDVYFNHAVNNVERLKNPEWHEFTERAKRQGKIRFRGMSGHAGRLIECLDYALDTGSVDVILVAHNFGQDSAFYERLTRSFDFIARQPDLPRVLQKAKSKGVGVIAMKTLMGARLNDMRPFEKDGATFAQAAFRWVLSNPHVDSLVISMTSPGLIDEYMGASGWQSSARGDLSLLQRYARMNGTSYCRHACNDCESACPYGVPIADVLRTRMYAKDYGDMKLARSEYGTLGAGASACLTCTDQPCVGACTYGLPIEKLLAPTHRMLTKRG
ncbi:MAG: aldo/keto reductase [Deltaproteobacteria bacterium]|nr:aldo/keto reductase [Deltaproteobacteria bacterium]